MQVDPRVYGSPEFDAKLPNPAAATEYKAPEPVPQQSILVGTQQTAQANLVMQENRREGVSWNQSLAAATDEMTPWAIARAMSGPTFTPEDGFNAAERISTLDMQLDSTDRKMLMKARSPEELEYNINNLDRSRNNMKQAGDNPWIGYTSLAFDPGYLAIDMVSAGAGHLAQLGRLGRTGQRIAVGATAAAGATALGVVEGMTRPMSDGELITNALLNGAAGAGFYSHATKRIEPRDPSFPSAELHSIAQPHPSVSMADEAIVSAVQKEIPLVTPARDIPVHEVTYAKRAGPAFDAADVPQTAKYELQRIGNSTDPLISNFAKRLDALMGEDVPMGVSSKAKRSMYDLGERRITLRPDATDWERLHEVTHALTADRIRFGRANPTTKIGELTRNLDDLHKVAQKAGAGGKGGKYGKYLLSTPDEFAAGIYSGDKKFYEFLKGIPVDGGEATVLSKAVQVIRRLLGVGAKDSNALTKALGITDELMQQPLQVKTTLVDGTEKTLHTADLLHAPAMNNADPAAVAKAIDKHETSLAGKIGQKISWSLHKTLANYGAEGKRVADLLVDNPIDMAGDSVVSQTRAIRADLAAPQYAYEDKLKDALSERGFGTLKRIFTPRAALKEQQTIEREVMQELWGREQAGRQGRQWMSQASPATRAMADDIDRMNAMALAEMKSAGVKGAEDIAEKSGYVSRKWDISKLDTMEQALIAGGQTEEIARKNIRRMVQASLRRANGWDDVLSSDIAKALLDRTRRKGYFEDSAFRSHAGNEAIAELRDILQGSGIRGDRLQQAIDVIAGKVDEAGKSSVLKHRVDLDMKSGMAMPDGSFVTVADLLNTDLTRIQEQYLDHVAGRAALARKGLGDVSSVGQLKADLMHSIPAENTRREASDLFDQTMNSILGNPVGEQLPDLMRNSQAVTRMVGLASSGLWQVTEFAPAMARYGALKTLGYMFRELPGASKLFSNAARDGSTATQLHSILTRNASADIRMRPFVQRMEDNFDIPPSATVTLALHQAQQLVPYLNAQKFVQTKQARVVANLVIDSLEKAGRGDKRAIAAWEQYGLKSHIVVELSDELKSAGMDTAKWSDGVWEKVRGPLTKAMDDAVLRNRTGEIPAFAQFSQVGKFIFTFRNFVLGAHNKVLAGTMGREGFAGLGLLMLYQMPLAMLATAANGQIQGKPVKDEKDLVTKSFGQMGSFGLFSEAFGVISGQKQQFGAPGLIAIDRLYKTVGQAAQGNWSQAASAGMAATPILSIIPGLRGFGEAFKD